MSISTYEALRPALDAIGCHLRSYPIAVGGFKTVADASMGLGVVLDVLVSLSPDVGDVLVDFAVIPCTSPLLLGAPFMETYGACFLLGLPHYGALSSPLLRVIPMDR